MWLPLMTVETGSFPRSGVILWLSSAIQEMNYIFHLSNFNLKSLNPNFPTGFTLLNVPMNSNYNERTTRHTLAHRKTGFHINYEGLYLIEFNMKSLLVVTEIRLGMVPRELIEYHR